jgi:hypothetical protein
MYIEDVAGDSLSKREDGWVDGWSGGGRTRQR